MRKAINGTLKILTISSVIVSMLLILVAYCTQYSIKEKSDLKSRTNILAQCLDGYDENSEINILTKMYDDVSDIRVTLIKSDGTVIYDNEADTTTMENHFERPEVKQAVTYGNGSSSRNSETIGEKINNVYGFDHNADSYYYFNMRYCCFVCECKAFDEIYFRSD